MVDLHSPKIGEFDKFPIAYPFLKMLSKQFFAGFGQILKYTYYQIWIRQSASLSQCNAERGSSNSIDVADKLAVFIRLHSDFKLLHAGIARQFLETFEALVP